MMVITLPQDSVELYNRYSVHNIDRYLTEKSRVWPLEIRLDKIESDKIRSHSKLQIRSCSVTSTSNLKKLVAMRNSMNA